MAEKEVLNSWYRPENLLKSAEESTEQGIRYIEVGESDPSLPGGFSYAYGFGLFGVDRRTLVLFVYHSTKIAVNSNYVLTNWTGWKIYQ